MRALCCGVLVLPVLFVACSLNSLDDLKGGGAQDAGAEASSTEAGLDGACWPVDCDALGATCGLVADACGNAQSCGKCPGGQLCADNKCISQAQCGNGSCDSGESCESCPLDCGCTSGTCVGGSCCTVISRRRTCC